MKSYALNISKQNIASFMSPQTKMEIVATEFLQDNKLNVDALDRLILPYLENKEENDQPYTILALLAQGTNTSLNDLANQMNMTSKSLARLT